VKLDTSVLPSPGAVNAGVNPRQPHPDPALAALGKAGIGRALVLGGGYSGGRFALKLAAAGVPVTATSRQPTSEDPGPIQRLRFDPESGCLPSAGELEGTTHLLVTIPPDRRGQDPVLATIAPVLDQLPLRWVGYLSSTGVYGDQGGGWVDETSPPRPGLERSQARLACERAWRARGLPLQVFRLPAIYGPGRTPFRGLRDGSARLIHKPDQVFSRIHVDDILGALAHCLALPADQRPETLIVADDRPCPSSETLGYAAHLLGCRLPVAEPYAEAALRMSPMARGFWSENRRVSNRLLCQGLGYRLRYRCYREGYRACLAEEPHT
jgi:nucleoside-diphosphate-sugar epimerase